MQLRPQRERIVTGWQNEPFSIELRPGESKALYCYGSHTKT